MTPPDSGGCLVRSARAANSGVNVGISLIKSGLLPVPQFFGVWVKGLKTLNAPYDPPGGRLLVQCYIVPAVPSIKFCAQTFLVCDWHAPWPGYFPYLAATGSQPHKHAPHPNHPPTPTATHASNHHTPTGCGVQTHRGIGNKSRRGGRRGPHCVLRRHVDLIAGASGDATAELHKQRVGACGEGGAAATWLPRQNDFNSVAGDG